MLDEDSVRKVIQEKTNRGEVVDFTNQDGAKPIVPANFIRDILIGLNPNVEVRLPGLRIKGAKIVGSLDLTDCRGAGSLGLPALTLEECDIEDEVKFDDARFARVSLKASRFRRLSASGINVDGDLDLTDVTPLPVTGEQDELKLKMNTARIGGDVWLNGAGFVASKLKSENVSSAVRMQSAVVGGNIFYLPSDSRRATCRGAMLLSGTTIGGSLVFIGVNLEAHSSGEFALNLDNVVVRGDVMFATSIEHPFEIAGILSLKAIRVKGAVTFQGAQVRSGEFPAIDCSYCDVSGNFGFYQLGGQAPIVDGGVSLISAGIGKCLFIADSKISSDSGVSVLATSCVVGEDVQFLSKDFQCEISGSVVFSGSRIGGSLWMGGVRLTATGPLSLDCSSVDIGGSVVLVPQNCSELHFDGGIQFDASNIEHDFHAPAISVACASGPAVSLHNSKIQGTLDFGSGPTGQCNLIGGVRARGVKIGRDFNLDGSRIEATGENLCALDITGAHVGGDLALSSDPMMQFEAIGTVVMSGATVGGSLDAASIKITSSREFALALDRVRIEGDCYLGSMGPDQEKVEINSAVFLVGAKIVGSMYFQDFAVTPSNGIALVARDAAIGGALIVRESEFHGQVNLRGANVGRLSDDPIGGWKGCSRLVLDGLSYRNLDIDGFSDAKSIGGRISWLKKSGEHNAHWFFGGPFMKQPWRECAAALIRAGHYREARVVAREEQREANRQNPFWAKPFVWLFAEQAFGYGQSIYRSIVTLGIFWALGAISVGAMIGQGVLVQDSNSNSICSNADPALYALDLAVPILSLNEVNKCEFAGTHSTEWAKFH